MEKEKHIMRIAIPVADGRLCPHFGHCEAFALVDVNPETKEIVETVLLPAPDHQPGLLPQWLEHHKATVVIAGGMGQRAQDLFSQKNIRVITGAPAEPHEEVVRAYLNDTLHTGDNICDH
jgi:predicted Fe-Mo cluster-binding NifX family protein